MAVLRVNSAEFARYHRQLAERFRPALLRGVHSGAARAVQHLVGATRVAPPANPAGIGTGGAVNTGQFIRNWRWYKLDDGATISNATGYGPVIEGGRRAGAKVPPLDAIYAWARRRLGLSHREAMRARYPIAKAIARRGLLGRRIVADNSSEILRLVNMEVIHELERAIATPPTRR